MLYVTSEKYCKIYHSSKFSHAFILCFCFWAFILISPFFLAIATSGFWPLNNVYYEQPVVNLRSEYILMGSKDSSGLFYSNIEEIPIKNNEEIAPILKIKRIDENVDGIIDRFEFTLEFKGDNDLKRSDLFLFFDYGLRDKVRLQMQSFIHLQFSNPSGLIRSSAIGDLEFRQTNALESTTFTNSIFNQTSFKRHKNDLYLALLENSNRNCSLFLKLREKYTSAGIGNHNEIKVEIRIPTFQDVRYVPSIIDSWKIAWTQYLSLFIPIYLILSSLLIFIYKSGIIKSGIKDDFTYKIN